MKPTAMTDLSKVGQFLALGLGVLVVLVVANWTFLSVGRVQSDLREYTRVVRNSTVSLQDKDRLLDLLEGLEDQLRDGHRIDFWRWRRHDQAIRELLAKGIDGDEAHLVERILRRAKNDCVEKSR